jgi:hypothetical protein
MIEKWYLRSSHHANGIFDMQFFAVLRIAWTQHRQLQQRQTKAAKHKYGTFYMTRQIYETFAAFHTRIDI